MVTHVETYIKYLIKPLLYCYHTFTNPTVNPADILPVRGMPKLVIATEAAAVWTAPPLPLLIPGICVVRFESIVIAPSDTV